MNEITQFLQQHLGLIGAAAAAIALSALVQTLPAPAPGGNLAYLWFYKFIQGILANFQLVKAAPRGKRSKG